MDGDKAGETGLATAASVGAAEVVSVIAANDVPVGRYEQLSLLGRGGMGEVLLYRDKQIGRELAVKVARAAVAPDVRRRFLREALLQARLEHPAFVPVYDVAIDAGGATYFTMRRIQGRTLESVIELHRSDAGVARDGAQHRLLSAFNQLCLAVDYAHSRGVVHRDIKPENVMLGDFGEIYLLDWGIAKVKDEPDDAAAAPRPGESAPAGTAEGSMMGSLGYMSPEQVRGEHATLDGRSDLYALGAILFELLTLERLHRRGSLAEMVASTLDVQLDRSPAGRAPRRDIAPELDAICQRATAPNREERFATTRALSEALDAFMEGDRDRALRRRRADEHAQRALVALAETGLERQVVAGQEASQALAFDPEHRGARETLLAVLTRPPSAAPAEVTESVERSRQQTEAQSWRVGGITSLFFKVVVVVLLWTVGVWDVPLAAVMLGCGVVGAVLLLIASRRATGARALALTGCALMCVENAIAMRWTSPVVIVPTLTIALATGTVLWSTPRQRLPLLVMAALVLVVPFALEAAGVISATIVASGGTAVITPRLGPLPSWILWVFVAQAVGALLSMSSLLQTADRVRATETRLNTQAWLLRKVLGG